jgi:hypothetical protein
VCVCVCLRISCVRKSQAISTKLGMGAQNPKCEVEFVCGTNRILTSGFMPPSLILAYYSIDLFAFFTSRQLLNRLTDPFEIWWPTSDPQRLLPEMFQIYQNPKWRPQAGGHLGFLQIPITFEPLDRFFRNLVANSGPTRAITQNIQIYQNPRWRP